jgi:hypothetical protein
MYFRALAREYFQHDYEKNYLITLQLLLKKVKK